MVSDGIPRDSSESFLKGIQLASGDYTVHCDSDDWMDVHAIKELYTFALSGHYDMVFYDFYRSDGVSTCS